jgi:phospholipid/cholesterol/gamma-HCH transport system ATP-binding protein
VVIVGESGTGKSTTLKLILRLLVPDEGRVLIDGEDITGLTDFVDLDVDRVLHQFPSELSGGMRKRVGIARGMANNPEIMLYDEPTSGLDPLTTATITKLILKLQRELNVTSVVVSHDIRSVFKMASKVALLNEQRITFFGTPEEMAGTDDKYIRDFLGGV